MTGSIERVWRNTTVRRMSLMPMLMLVVVHNPTDPNRKITGTGYGGVLPVPASAAVSPSANTRPDALLEQQHRDQRAARGRVLYASGRAPQVTTATRPEAKQPRCERRVVQGKSPAPAPNS